MALTSNPTVSVIIIVKNDAGIERTLELLYKQQGISQYEVIVIDASARDTLLSIKEKFPQVRWNYFDQKGQKFTIPAQRNRGIELSNSDIVVFIDASCEPNLKWLATMVRAIRGGEDVVCGPCRASNSGNLVHYIEEHTQRTYVEECTTINVAFRRIVYEKVGKFDLSLSYGEDVDFFWRARLAGFKICYEPEAYIAHDYGNLSEQRRRAFRYGMSRAALHKKHWRTHLYRLARYEPHVWVYPLFILGLPLTLVWPFYPLVLIVPIIKNRSVSVIAHHLIFGCGVIFGMFKAL